MKMRKPLRMPPKMKMMSRWNSCFFSFPFWHLMTKGEWKCHICTHLGMCRLCIELMSFTFRFELPRSCVRTMWCENICNVCYFVPRCVVYLCFKEVVLGWKFFPWLVTVFSVFWFRRAGYSRIQAGFSGFPDRSLRAPTWSLRVLLPNTLFLVWISCHMHHTCFFTHLLTSLQNI